MIKYSTAFWSEFKIFIFKIIRLSVHCEEMYQRISRNVHSRPHQLIPIPITKNDYKFNQNIIYNLFPRMIFAFILKNANNFHKYI